MAGGEIDLGKGIAGDELDGTGELLLPGEGLGIGAGIVIGVLVVGVDIVVADIPVAGALGDQQGVVIDLGNAVVIQKRGIQVRVPGSEDEVGGLCLVALQQLLQARVLLAGLDNPVDGHVLGKPLQQLPALLGQGIELAFRHIPAGEGAGQDLGEEIEGDDNGQSQAAD